MRFILLLLPTFLFGGIPTVIDNPELMNYVEKRLPHQGVLKQTKEGFLYVSLPQGYVFDLIPKMHKPGLIPPPYFQVGKAGAHITVASLDEMKGLGFPPVIHLGKMIPFQVLNLSKVQSDPGGFGSNVEIYMLEVASKELDEIREVLGLPKATYAFHITVGLEVRPAV